MTGFECASQRLRPSRRLDITSVTGHDVHAYVDYCRLSKLNTYSARDGVRWHLIERRPRQYDFTSVIPMIHAAQSAGIQIIWDLCHYGYPEDIDIFKPEFVDRFADFARAFIKLLCNETDETPVVLPINEISYFSWAGAEVAYFNPFTLDRGYELKEQLVRATIAGVEAIWDVAPRARIVNVDPLINVVSFPDSVNPNAALRYHDLQYQARDMLVGREARWLGGNKKYLDIIGVSYYRHNQWFFGDALHRDDVTIATGDPHYRPLSDLLVELHRRYDDYGPLFIAETGSESGDRAKWLRVTASQIRKVMKMGIPVAGVCWYPALNHPGWDDDRHCEHGLWDFADRNGERELYQPLAEEFRLQQQNFDKAISGIS